MKRIAGVTIVLSAVFVAASVALAASPKKGGTYVGDIKASPFTMHINLGVNPLGTKLAHFTYLCGTGRPPTSVFGIPIDRTGHFKYTKMTGSVVVWKMAGRFLSATRAFVSLNSIACGGSKGSTTITLKR
jgi:hypothetical protein